MKALVTLGFALTLVGGVACSAKKDTPDPAPLPDTCSYVRDGRVMKGSAQASLQAQLAPGGGGNEDVLSISLASPVAGYPYESTYLYFYKPTGTPESAFKLRAIGVNYSFGPPPYNVYNTDLRYTLTRTSRGGYSGTFSGTAPATATDPVSTITLGVFTDAQL